MLVSAPSLLTVVKASGGRTPRVQSTLASHYELDAGELKSVKRRVTCREDVISVGVKLIIGFKAMGLHLSYDRGKGFKCSESRARGFTTPS